MYLPGLMLLVAVIVLGQQSLVVAVSVLPLPAGKAHTGITCRLACKSKALPIQVNLKVKKNRDCQYEKAWPEQLLD